MIKSTSRGAVCSHSRPKTKHSSEVRVARVAAAALLALFVLNLVPLGSAKSASNGAGNAEIGTIFGRPALSAGKVKMGKAKAEIHVCLSGTCSAHGGEAVLVEIEELASAFSEVCVRESGCLGLCRQAPAALTVKFDDNGKNLKSTQYSDSIGTEFF